MAMIALAMLVVGRLGQANTWKTCQPQSTTRTSSTAKTSKSCVKRVVDIYIYALWLDSTPTEGTHDEVLVGPALQGKRSHKLLPLLFA